MSLETDVANLVTKAESLISYFTGRKTSIDQSVAAAIAAVPETSRTWYVDQVAGLDTNAGTKDAPFKTIDKALKSTPNSGTCQINLMNDYTLDYGIVSTCAYVYIYGGLAATSPKLRLKYYALNQSDGTTITQLGGFLFLAQCSNFEMRQVDLVLPATTGVTPVPSLSRQCSFLRTNAGSNLPPVLGVSLETFTITMDPTFFGWLVGASTCSVILNANGMVFPSGFGGKYFNGVASGTDPKTLNNILTNLSSL